MYCYYDRLWERIERSLASRDSKDLLNDFTTLLVVNQGWSSAGHSGSWSGITSRERA
jgi:hypothetical protein